MAVGQELCPSDYLRALRLFLPSAPGRPVWGPDHSVEVRLHNINERNRPTHTGPSVCQPLFQVLYKYQLLTAAQGVGMEVGKLRHREVKLLAQGHIVLVNNRVGIWPQAVWAQSWI